MEGRGGVPGGGYWGLLLWLRPPEALHGRRTLMTHDHTLWTQSSGGCGIHVVSQQPTHHSC